MKRFRNIIVIIAAVSIAAVCTAQVENAGGVRKRAEKDKKTAAAQNGGVTDRMQDFYTQKSAHEADLSYMREIYRELDLTKPENTPLYFPEDVIDGQKNLFRIILDLVIQEKVPAYEYLDGREIFTDDYKVKVDEMLDRFGIYYTTSGRGNQKYVIEEADVPTSQVLNYYILEKWEFDRRSNRMKTRVEAICPILNRMGDYGGEARYPMFWVKYDKIRPYLASQYVFLSDDNNLAQYSIDDYFNLGMYKGDIYKTRNLRNLSMAQMYPDPDDLARAQDSIDNRLRNYGKNMWVPTREEYLAQKEREEEIAKAIAAGDTIPDRTTVSDNDVTEAKKAKPRKTTKKRTAKAKTPKVSKPASSSAVNSSASKSVRRRKK